MWIPVFVLWGPNSFSSPHKAEVSMNQVDSADSERIVEAITGILPVLEEFYKFEGPDEAALRCAEWKAKLDVDLPEKGEGLNSVLNDLRDTVIPNGLRNGHPGFSGWVTTSPTTSGTAAHLASAMAGSQRVWVQAFNFLEKVSLRWLAELLGISAQWGATYTSGGSSANLVGLGAARQWAVEQIGVDPSMTGLPDGVEWRIYASAEVHHVVNRAAAVLGIGRRSVVGIPVTSDHVLDINILRQRLAEDAVKGIRPMALVATAGTVNMGTVDPISEMADLAEEYGAWLHIDGAYGMFGRLDDRVKHLYDGIERADSVAADPHKWLAAPLGNGVTFVRDIHILRRTFTLEPASYLEGSAIPDAPRSPFDNFGEAYHDLSVDQSAASRGVAVWAILKEMGIEGIKDRIIRHNSFARLQAELASADPKLELLSTPVLSICCFRYNDGTLSESRLTDLNTRIAADLRAESNYVPSTTMVDGRYAIRPCYINPRNREEDVRGLAKRVRELGDELCHSGQF